MATSSHELGRETAIVPPITLPITSRGLVVTDHLCWFVLGVAMVAAAAVILYLNRGTTFYLDELARFTESPGLSLHGLLSPATGHLSIVSRLFYKGTLEAFGAHYAIFRAAHVAMLAITVGLLYSLIKRRIGALPALAPALALLFLGTAWTHVLVPQGFTIFLSIAAGLAALLALERDDRRGEIAACALITFALATYTIGLAFLVGVAISVLLRPDRLRRAWIFMIPLALYLAWWVWAASEPNSSEGATTLSNILLAPNYAADSAAAVSTALLGLGYDFNNEPPPTVDVEWGWVLTVIVVLALGWRLRRGDVPRSLWVSLGIVLTYWSLGALAFDALRPPGATRYIFMGAVGLVLVGTDAARFVRFSRLGLIALFAVCAISLVGNLASLRAAGSYFRNYGNLAGTQFAMLELARDHVDPDFDPTTERVPTPFALGIRAGEYQAAADRYGSLADPLPVVEGQSGTVRENADLLLARALDLRLGPASGEPRRDCRRLRPAGVGESLRFDLPPGGALLRDPGAGGGGVSVGRFGSAPSVNVGRLAEGEARILRVPPDSSPRPWTATVAAARSLEVCALG